MEAARFDFFSSEANEPAEKTTIFKATCDHIHMVFVM